PRDYAIDPFVLDRNSASAPEESFFLHSLRLADPAASGHAKQPTSGVYASPAPLPNGKMLVSFGAAQDTGAFSGDYDVFVMDPVSGVKTKLLGAAGSAEI